MILSFDKFERYELPQVTLCNPNSRATEVDGKITITDTVGVLSNPKGMNLKLNFNAPHELSFDYYRHKSSDPIKQSFYDSIYEAIQTDRYIYLTDIGYFIISSVTDSDEDNIDKKSISCKSCEENELATAEGLHLKEGTYYLHTEDSQGLLDLFLPKTAGWTMGYIDPSLLTKPYFVEDTEVDNGYNFLYTTTQDMFECIVEPDIIKRTISVYSRVYYAEHHLTDIHIAKYNLLKHKTVEENDEDKYTALNVQGKDENLEIRTVNPTGKNVIYNFEPRYSWMSSALQQAIEKWQEKCESAEDEYLTLQQSYYTELEKLFNEEKDIEVLKGELEQLKETKDIAFTMADGNEKDQSLINVNKSITAKQAEINNVTATYNSHKETIRINYEIPIAQINEDCALDITAVDIHGNAIFTIELLNELMTHIKPTEYVDEYMLVTESMTYPQRFEKAKELMDRAQSQLVKISSGQKTYSIDTRSFLFNKQFKHFSEQLCAGAIIYVETKRDIMEQLHLTGIDISFDEKSAALTLGNKYDRSDLKALYEDALGQNSKSFNELKYIASIVEDQQKQLDYQRNWVADLRTLTLDNVLTSEDQAIEINNRGLIGRKRKLDENGEWDFDENGNPLFDPEQVKLINNTLVFTNDNWQHASTAVGKIAVGYNSDGSVKYDYGMNGRVIIGELILGNNLVLTGTGAGIKITDSNGNDAFYADDNGNLVLNGRIEAKSGTIGGWNITDWNLSSTVYNNEGKECTVSFINTSDYYHNGTSGRASDVLTVYDASNTNNPWPFSLWKDGTLNCSKINATGGNIGGWTIDTNVLKNGTIGQSGSAFMCTGTDDTYTLGGHTGTGWVFGAGANFGVNNQGNLFASGALITGTLKAGGWTIGGGSIICDKYNGINNNLIALISPTTLASSGAGSDVFIVRVGGTDYFRLNSNGSLYCTKANIKGHIEADSGTFKGTINAGSILGSGFKIQNGHKGSAGLQVGTFDVGASAVSFEKEYLSAQYRGDTVEDARWYAVVFAANEWDNGSDKRLKNSINDFNEKYENFFNNLHPVTFKYNNGRSGRIHSGFIAQEVVDSLEKSGLSTTDFAAPCLLNYGTDKEGYWWLRRDQFVALNTWQIQKLKKKVAELENTISQLQQALTAS